jgi:hypothetical protein
MAGLRGGQDENPETVLVFYSQSEPIGRAVGIINGCIGAA